MLHPHTEVRFVSREIGKGVFATEPIPKGTVVWVLDAFDRIYTEAEVRRMAPVYQEILETYCFRDRVGRWVFCWDNTRFINHSFTPTCITTPYGLEIAVRDIAPGEQITNDYGFFNIIEPLECVPEPGSTRTKAMPDDILTHAGEWDALIRDALLQFESVDQPLTQMLSPELQERLKRIARGLEEPESIRSCYYNGTQGGQEPA